MSLHAITATGLALQRVILRCSKSCFKQQGQSETAISKWATFCLTLLTVQEKRDAARSEHNPARERFMTCKGLYDKKVKPSFRKS